LQNTEDLSSLLTPFDRIEIDLVVKHLPSDKALGPDSFNIDFVKKCWSIISNDFYNLCDAFHNGEVCL
jgi:hypothetical protein